MVVHSPLDVYAWYRSTASLDSDALKLADQPLSIEERIRRDRLHFEADRRDFTFAHDLLRRALSKHSHVSPAHWRFSTNNHGKPFIDSTDPQLRALSFSLAHTKGCVACAITVNAALGVDIERIDQARHAQEIADQYFSEKEATWLRQCPDKVRSGRFAELWTLKEAFLKAIGVGLSGSLADVAFIFDEQPHIELSESSAINPSDWHFASFEPFQNMRLAIVVRSVARPRFITLQDKGDGRALAPIHVSAA